MSDLSQMLDAMAAVIWREAGGSGKPPAYTVGGGRAGIRGGAPAQAARDLRNLYEDGNEKSLEEMNEADAATGLQSPRGFGRLLAEAALGVGPKRHLESLGIVVPRFKVRLEGDELVWDGDVGGDFHVSRGSNDDEQVNPHVRAPTDEEIAAAWRYIEREYTLKEGNIDGEQWAEGLAFGRSIAGLKAVDPRHYKELMEAARDFRSQLTDDQWKHLAARADHLAREQGEPARFSAARNGIEEELGINPARRLAGDRGHRVGARVTVMMSAKTPWHGEVVEIDRRSRDGRVEGYIVRDSRGRQHHVRGRDIK